MRTRLKSIGFAALTIRLLLSAFLLAPFAAIVSVSFQGQSHKYWWFPLQFEASAYSRVIVYNELEIRDSILWTITLLSPITLLAGAVGIALFYQLRAADLDGIKRRKVIFLILSISFLPTYAMHSAINQVFDFVAIQAETSTLKLGIGYLAYGVAIFSISLLLMGSGATLEAEFQQLLLDSGSRTFAFRHSYLRGRWIGVSASLLLTFSGLWSEFVLAVQLGSPFRQTFAVKLAGAHGQQVVDFPVYAVGAVISAGVFVVVALAIIPISRAILHFCGREASEP